MIRRRAIYSEITQRLQVEGSERSDFGYESIGWLRYIDPTPLLIVQGNELSLMLGQKQVMKKWLQVTNMVLLVYGLDSKKPNDHPNDCCKIRNDYVESNLRKNRLR